MDKTAKCPTPQEEQQNNFVQVLNFFRALGRFAGQNDNLAQFTFLTLVSHIYTNHDFPNIIDKGFHLAGSRRLRRLAAEDIKEATDVLEDFDEKRILLTNEQILRLCGNNRATIRRVIKHLQLQRANLPKEDILKIVGKGIGSGSKRRDPIESWKIFKTIFVELEKKTCEPFPTLFDFSFKGWNVLGDYLTALESSRDQKIRDIQDDIANVDNGKRYDCHVRDLFEKIGDEGIIKFYRENRSCFIGSIVGNRLYDDLYRIHDVANIQKLAIPAIDGEPINEFFAELVQIMILSSHRDAEIEKVLDDLFLFFGKPE